MISPGAPRHEHHGRVTAAWGDAVRFEEGKRRLAAAWNRTRKNWPIETLAEKVLGYLPGALWVEITTEEGSARSSHA